MVGVAGRSKGCTTCQRRKIRCGQERPYCFNCIRSGRTCEGYERYAVFINRTGEGLQRRRPQEEAKSAASDTGTTPFAPATAHLPMTPSTQAIWSVGLLASFWESYSPAHTSASVPTKGPAWLYIAMSIVQPTAILHQSLLVLSIVRKGRTNNDDTFVNEGQRIYGQAVSMLQRTLHDRQRIWHEETLAAVRAMAIYEVSPMKLSGGIFETYWLQLYEVTSNTSASWQNHVSGLASLMEFRGPARYGTPLARAVFEEFRYPLVRHPCKIKLFTSSVYSDDTQYHATQRNRFCKASGADYSVVGLY